MSIQLDHIEALAGPLPKGREYERFMSVAFDGQRNLPQFLRAPKAKADAALAEAYAVIERQARKLHEARWAQEEAEGALDAWLAKYNEARSAQEDAEADLAALKDRRR